MTKPILLAFALTLVRLTTVGQDYASFVVKLMNETGKPIEVVLTHYDLDTTPFVSRLNFTDEKSKTTPGYFRGIRLDIVALNGKDTVFSTSVKHVNGGQKTVRIKNDQHSLDKPLKAIPRLRITGSNKTGGVFAVGDFQFLKLHSNKKVKGFVSSYNKSSLTIRTKSGKTIVIQKDDLKAIRERKSLYDWGPRFSLFPYSKYEEILDIKFEYVRWVDTGEGILNTPKWIVVE